MIKIKDESEILSLDSGQNARESLILCGKRYLQDAYFIYDNAANNIVLLSN
tara:strand:+ start:609 stop:761 length:153 start_codon:yes stop_codon:yes gene_type:complete